MTFLSRVLQAERLTSGQLCLSYTLLSVKLNAYGFDESFLKYIKNYTFFYMQRFCSAQL